MTEEHIKKPWNILAISFLLSLVYWVLFIGVVLLEKDFVEFRYMGF